MDFTILKYALSMAMYFAVLICIVELMRKHCKLANIVWICSLLTFPLWIMGGVSGWFRWAKILSVILPTIIVGFCRISNFEERQGKFWGFFQKRWILWFTYGILFLNILEATLKDVALGNYANAGCGFLLCVTIPFAPKYWKYDKQGVGDLICYTTIGWNFLYTTWNLCFVFGESPNYFASSICILLAAELYPFIKRKPELYIMARVYTLATHMILRSCFGPMFITLMDASSWYNESLWKYWGIANLILIIPYLFWYMWQLHTGNASHTFIRKDSYLHSKFSRM
ncbi:hypothetical protein KQI36_14120 [Clostridium senegalense]|uniref:hypothetical protein n=1 Tax=Clostridium senegalense TaxID=1465809 RepID=UPI001C104E89|nr:hypothetical protein [Clostridium senegalense]MBU5227768.1 hypothetical protein [Clostridium senegalense]